jgi:diguanylate cyclase (GGDEF)-like protein
MTAVGGFALWGAVFPTAALLHTFFPAQPIEPEAWNIPKYLVAVGMILTLLEDQIQTSNYFAFHDELTGLPNRRLLHDRLERALAYAHRNRTKLAILILDLNRFKEINDTYGHRAGDLVLREVVARLGQCIHADDTLARSGGDEFTIVGRVAGMEGAEALRSTLQLALSSPINIEGTDVQTGLSIGLALYPDDGSDLDRLCAAADQAMYAVKRAANVIPANEAASQNAQEFNEVLSRNNT